MKQFITDLITRLDQCLSLRPAGGDLPPVLIHTVDGFPLYDVKFIELQALQAVVIALSAKVEALEARLAEDPSK